MTYTDFNKFLATNGVPRTNIKDGEYVLDTLNALKGLIILENNSGIVLGGDVYDREEDGYFRPTGDNWFFEKLASEDNKDFSNRSIQESKLYITKYNGIKNPYFVIVVDD
jgi:hypothetical protein